VVSTGKMEVSRSKSGHGTRKENERESPMLKSAGQIAPQGKKQNKVVYGRGVQREIVTTSMLGGRLGVEESRRN